ncbi:MAG: PIN domain-containing protein [Tepidisphaeraceae bacterium]
MNTGFADTSYFPALLIPADVNHPIARRWAETHRVPLITSEYVLIEVGNYLSPVPARRLFGQFLRAIRSDSRMTVVPASTNLLERGSELYEARLDKPWSLTDCISFVIMKDHAIQDALTADRHFEQAGFTAILKQS